MQNYLYDAFIANTFQSKKNIFQADICQILLIKPKLSGRLEGKVVLLKGGNTIFKVFGSCGKNLGVIETINTNTMILAIK